MSERVRERQRVTVRFTKPSLTVQAAKDECDINRIMRRFSETKVLTHVNDATGQYGDFTGAAVSYHSALNLVLDAQAMFLSLPSSIRKKFDNDPEKFLAFAEDPANAQEMVDLGLAQPVVAPKGATESVPAEAGPEAAVAADSPEAEPQ